VGSAAGAGYGPACPRVKGAARPCGTGLRSALDPRVPPALGRELRAGRWPCPPHAPAASCPGGSFRISAESLRGEQLADLLDGFAVAEAFSGPVVEFGGDPVQISLAVHGQVAALREVLAQ